MKKGNFILSVLIAFIIYSFNTSCNFISTKADAYPALLKRADTANSAEFANLQQLYKKYVNALEKDSNDYLDKIKLVELYINEARITGNLSYYNNASMQVLNSITENKSVNKDIVYKALAYKATVFLSLHQFADSKKVAEQALQINPYDADIYGALVDANVELGSYDEAVKLCDKMMSIRPDIRSYSRVSYIRQIFGDNKGAIAAMRMAVESGAEGMENTEWARVQLGDLYLNTGHTDTAKMLYESSLFVRPNYPFAEMGLAKMFSIQKQYDSSIVHCKNAIRVISESSFISFLGEQYKKKGDLAKAQEVQHDVLNLMLENEAQNQKEMYTKHNGNRELANAYLHINKLDDALSFAKKDLEMRPNNIDANELVAWIYYLKNEKQLAQTHIEKALATHSQNAALLYKASLIYSSIGDEAKAIDLKTTSFEINSGLQTDNFIAIK